MDDIKEILKGVVEYLNDNYNQDSDNYNIFTGAIPGVIKYGGHAAISVWGCGAIVCIYDQMFFIEEDDGNWWCPEGFVRSDQRDDNKTARELHRFCGYQTSFSIGWGKGFAEAMNALVEYTEKNGEPVYYSGLTEKIVCHYKL